MILKLQLKNVFNYKMRKRNKIIPEYIRLKVEFVSNLMLMNLVNLFKRFKDNQNH